MNRFFRPPATTGQKAFVPLAIVLSLVSISYCVGLGSAPLYLGGDEAQFATHAQAIASTGRDLNGHVLPLFFHITDPLSEASNSLIWYQPMLFYLIAPVLTFAPVSEWVVRMPSAVIGLLNAFLIFAVGRRLFEKSWHGLLAALLLMASPAHYIFSRQALDYICPLPFVLAWLWCLLAFIDTNRARYLLAAGLVLALGLFSYIASWITMSLYLGATLIVVWRSAGRIPAKSAALATGFGAPLLFAGLWLWTNPGMLADTFQRYGRNDGLPQMASAVIERISIYWEYWNPSYLFFSGGANPTQGTRNAGVFLLPMGFFLLSGLYDLWQRRSLKHSVILFGLASAPLPAVIMLPPSAQNAIARELPVLPFTVLVCVFGVAALLRHPARSIRLVTILLLLAMPLQFGYFLHDYFGGYRISSADRFDPVNVRDVAAAVISSDAENPVPAVYLSNDLDDGAVRWRFYMLKHRREDLWARTRGFGAEQFNVNEAPLGSLFVVYADDPKWANVQGGETCNVAHVVLNAIGTRTAVIWRKTV